jgi:hypothetical protein
MHHHTQPDPLAPESFPTDPTGLPEATRPQQLELAPGDTLHLRVGPVAKRGLLCGSWRSCPPRNWSIAPA